MVTKHYKLLTTTRNGQTEANFPIVGAEEGLGLVKLTTSSPQFVSIVGQFFYREARCLKSAITTNCSINIDQIAVWAQLLLHLLYVLGTARGVLLLSVENVLSCKFLCQCH